MQKRIGKLMDLGSDFWWIFGQFLESKSSQNRTKSANMRVPRRCQKKSWKRWAQDHGRHAVNGGVGPYKSISQPIQGSSSGALDTPLRATRARWRILAYFILCSYMPIRWSGRSPKIHKTIANPRLYYINGLRDLFVQIDMVLTFRFRQGLPRKCLFESP